MKKYGGSFLLVLAALIWGCAFVAQSIGMDYIGPWTFTCLRNYIGALTLLVLMPLVNRSGLGGKDRNGFLLLRGGVSCGIVLAAASMFQQAGIQYTSAGKAGFITALYVVIVPFFSLFLGRKVSGKIWASALIALAGFYLLSMKEGLSLGKGDGMVLVCAFLYAVHILVIDRYSSSLNGVHMSCVQFVAAALVCTVPMIALEHPSFSQIKAAALPLLYAGILSSGVAYTLQILGQKGTDPSVSTLLLSFESVFSVLAAFVILHEALSFRELSGCVLVFAAVILAQLSS